jgi:hypothetical protein
LVEISAALLVGMYLFYRIRARDIFGLVDRIRKRPLSVLAFSMYCWLVYVVGVCLSIALSPIPHSGIGYLNKLWHAMLFPIVLGSRFSREDLRRLGSAFVISASVAATVAVALFAFRHAAEMRWPFIGETTFAILLTMAWLAVLGNISMRNVDPTRGHTGTVAPRGYAEILFGVPIIAAVFFSTLKAPAVLAVVGSCILVLASPSRVTLLSIPLLAVMSIISPHTLWLKVQWIVSGNAIDRYVIWNAGKDLLSSVPLFGFGPDSYAALLPASAKAAISSRLPSSWHNDFLQTILESGWLTGIAYIALIGSVFYVSIASIKHHIRDGQRKLESVVLTLVLGAFIAFSVANAVVSTAVLGATLWVLLGLIANVTMKEEPHE